MNRKPGTVIGKAVFLIYFFLIILPAWSVSRQADDIPESTSFYQLTPGLSGEEIRWIEEHRTIRVSGPKSFPPFHSYTEDGTPQGIASDYIKILFENLGIEVEIVSGLLWPDVLDKIRNKKLDVLACSAKSPEREEYLLFTDPHLSFPMVIVTRDDYPFIGGLEDLTNEKVAVVTKTVVSDWLKRDNIEIIPVQCSSPLDALETVSVGSADAYIGNLASCSYQIREQGLSNLKVAAPTEYNNYDLYIAVRSDWPELVSIINKTLGAITPAQHSAIRNQWLSIRYEHGVKTWDVLRVILILTLIASLIITIILRWNRRLAREIETRKKTEEELKEALENLKSLSGLLPICSHCKNIRDDKGYWNQIEEYLEAHTEASLSHSLCPKCYEELYGNESWFDQEENTTSKNDRKDPR